MSLDKEIRRNSSPAFRLAVISMILCGLVFPLAITGIAQVLFPGQANGSTAHFSSSDGRVVGSYLIAQSFARPWLFHSRNSTLSASGVDPDITLEDALSQIPRVSNWTGIGQNDLKNLVNQYVEGTLWIFGYPYVNVLRLNLALIQNYETEYRSIDPSLFVN